jgi:acyl carrier protein
MTDSKLPAPPDAAARFKAELLHFINEVLPRSHRQTRGPLELDGATLLFESGRIDSLAILPLIAFVERATGQRIPPRKVVMKHFRSVDAICDSFGPTEAGS